MLDDSELEQLMNDLESDRVERKESIHDHRKIRQAMCAFANDMPGHAQPGVVFIGVKDDGTCANLPITDDLLLTLSSMRPDGNILPLPEMTVQKRMIKGCAVAVVIVEPSLYPPVRYNGRIWIRVGPRRATASEEEEQRLSERRRAQHLPWDIQPIEPSLLADFVPGAYVQFLRIDGTELTHPIIDQKNCHGPMPELLLELDTIIGTKIGTNIRIKTDISSGTTETQQPDYPIPALQELVRNAIMHRDYEMSNAPTRITWFVDRIEIQNPGGP